MTNPTIHTASPLSADAHEVLTAHAAMCQAASPPGSCHFLDKEALTGDNVWFALMQMDNQVVGCVALQNHGAGLCELKSMHVKADYRGQGLSKRLLAAAEDKARSLGASKIALETGSERCQADAFAPARRLYERAGYRFCEPFGDYASDPYSVFMTKSLQ